MTRNSQGKGAQNSLDHYSGPKAKEVGPALFDLATDLGETKNVAAAHPDRVAAMRAKLAEITGQPLPKKDQKPEDE